MAFYLCKQNTFDLTDDQRRLCIWVAAQAREGVRRVHYETARTALGVADEKELTDLLRQLRERLDSIHEMIKSPIINTAIPYFDIHRDADHIWDLYCDAEREAIEQSCLENAYTTD